MIRGMVLHGDGHSIEGGEEAVAQWRETPDSHLWLDIEGAVTEERVSLLESMARNTRRVPRAGCSTIGIL